MSGLRTALFIDYENLINTLKSHHAPRVQEGSPAGVVPQLDFGRLIEEVQKRYGNLDAEDIIAVGDFHRHSRQSSRLGQIAHLVDINVYESHPARGQTTTKPGAKAFARNAGNVTLAYHVGLHVGRRPADIYLLLSGDSALATVADELLRLGKQVVFIIPEGSPSSILAERFHCLPLAEMCPIEPPQPQVKEMADSSPGEISSPGEEIISALSALHREFPGSGIPSALLRAMLGPAQAQRLLHRARSENWIDLWKDPSGIECASLASMRLGGRAVIMPVRPTLRLAAEVLLEVAKAAEASHKVWTRADLRKLIKASGDFSHHEAKRWLEMLLGAGILRDAALNRPDFRLEKVLSFLRKIEA